MLGMIGIRRRFGRRRQGGGGGGDEGGRGPNGVDPRWLGRVAEEGLVPASTLTPIESADVPAAVARIGDGQSESGERFLVSVGRSGGDALLGALAMATRTDGGEAFRGAVYAIAPAWGLSARRALGAVGATGFTVRPILAPGLVDAPAEVQPEAIPGLLLASPDLLAQHPSRPADRELARRALGGLAGLAAKHGGAIRGVGRSAELALLAKRVAAVRVDDEGVLLDLFVEPRKTERLRLEALPDALDRLEGLLRKFLNERELREGEEGFRARSLEAVIESLGLRAARRWPLGGGDSDSIDALGVLPEGRPAVVAIRQRLGLGALGPILDGALVIGPAIPTLLAEAGAPMRFDTPRLYLAAVETDEVVERVLACITLDSARLALQGESSVRLAGETPAARPAGLRGFDRRDERGRGRAPAFRERGAAPEAEAAVPSPEGEAPAAPVRDLREPGRDGGREGRRGGPPRPQAAPAGAASPRFEEVSLFELAEDDSGASAGSAEEGGRGRRRRRRRGRGRGRAPQREGGEGDGEDEADGEEEGRAEGWSDDDRALLSEFGADQLAAPEEAPPRRGRERERRGGRPSAEPAARRPAPAVEGEDEADLGDDLLPLSVMEPEFPEEPEPVYDDEEEPEEGDGEHERMRRERERRRRARIAKAAPALEPAPAPRPPKPRRVALLAHADRDSVAAAVLLARDLRLLEGIWVYPQSDLMTFFRGVAPDLRDETPIVVVGFTASPARETLQTAALYRDRLTWYDHHAWPPEDIDALRHAIGDESVHVVPYARSSMPLVLQSLTRRSRFSDKLVDLVTGRFSQHDFERWGRVWWTRLGDIAARTGERRADLEQLLVGRPSDLAREAAAVTSPAPPAEVAWVADRDFRVVHFGGHTLVVVPAPAGLDAAMAARVARERYGAALSLAYGEGDETIVLAADDAPGRRALDVLGMAEHLAGKHAWIDALPDADHVARIRLRDLATRPERLEEVLAEIAMGRSILEG